MSDETKRVDKLARHAPGIIMDAARAIEEGIAKPGGGHQARLVEIAGTVEAMRATIRHHEAEAAALRQALELIAVLGKKVAAHSIHLDTCGIAARNVLDSTTTGADLLAEMDALRDAHRAAVRASWAANKRAEAAEKARDEAVGVLRRVKPLLGVHHRSAHRAIDALLVPRPSKDAPDGH